MFELLYAINVVYKAFGLPGLCALSMAVEWRTACWLSSRMSDDTRRDKTSDTALKNSQSLPGAYIDEILLLCVTSHLSPSVPKLSLPGPSMSIMPCIDICASPIQDNGGGSLVKGSLESPQNDDAAGYVSDQSVRFFSVTFQDTDILILFYQPIRRQTRPSKLTSTAKAKMTIYSNIAGRAPMIANDSRSGTGHPSFHQNRCRIYQLSPPINSPERFLH